MQTNCVCLAKVVINKKLNTFRVVFSFDKFNKITVKNAALVTGDICSVNYPDAPAEIAKAIQNAKATLRTNNMRVLD